MKTKIIKQCPDQVKCGVIKNDPLSEFAAALLEATNRYNRACYSERIKRGIKDAKNRKDNKNNEK